MERIDRYRVFLSYAHENKRFAHDVMEAVKNDFIVLSDRDFLPGRELSQEVRHAISQAHLCLGLFTDQTVRHPWVHAELGFAIALNIPVLAIVTTKKRLARAFIEEHLPVKVKADGSDLVLQLRKARVSQLIEKAARNMTRVVEVVDFTARRSEALVRYADTILHVHGACLVRQRGPISTFSLPVQPKDTDIWTQLGSEIRDNMELREGLRSERMALERHARKAGCRLLINPSILSRPNVLAAPARLTALIEFLNSIKAENESRVAIFDGPFADGSLVAIGNRVMALSHTPLSIGYRQTLFTTHAPSILKEIMQFDEQLEAVLRQQGIREDQSIDAAIERLSSLARAWATT